MSTTPDAGTIWVGVIGADRAHFPLIPAKAGIQGNINSECDGPGPPLSRGWAV